MRVMIAVDGSAGSFEAVDQLGRVLSAERDELALYYSPPEVRVRVSPPDPKLMAQAREGLASTVFSEACKRLPAPLSDKVHTVTGMQEARHGILVEAEAWSADVVTVGARGLNTFERLLLGSVSRTIVHRSTIPVWVARSTPHDRRHGLRVLIPCENPELGRASAALLGRFTWPEGSCFTTLSVVPSVFAGRVPDWLEQQARGPEVEAMVQAWAREHDEELTAGRKRMEEFIKTLPPPLCECQPLIAEGEPAREILATIQKERIDLVVIGTHQRSIASMILGSTADAVLNHASCSVLVVPH